MKHIGGLEHQHHLRAAAAHTLEQLCKHDLPCMVVPWCKAFSPPAESWSAGPKQQPLHWKGGSMLHHGRPPPVSNTTQSAVHEEGCLTARIMLRLEKAQRPNAGRLRTMRHLCQAAACLDGDDNSYTCIANAKHAWECQSTGLASRHTSASAANLTYV